MGRGKASPGQYCCIARERQLSVLLYSQGETTRERSVDHQVARRFKIRRARVEE